MYIMKHALFHKLYIKTFDSLWKENKIKTYIQKGETLW